MVLCLGFVPLALTIRSAADDHRKEARLARAATQARTVLEGVIDLETGDRGFLVTGEPRFLEPWAAARRSLPGDVRRLRRLAAPDHARDLTDRLADDATSYLADYSVPLIARARRDRGSASRLVAKGEGKRRVDRLRGETSELTRLSDEQVAALRDAREASERRGVLFGFVGMFVSLSLLALFAAYLRRAIAVPVERLSETAHALGSGELSARVRPHGGLSEFSALAECFNSMAASLQSSRGSLEAANEELAAARTQAEHANRSKSEFLSRMSHELRTPLNSVLGFGQLLQMDELDETQRQNVGHIISSGNHLLELINEVLDLSRIEAGRMSISQEPVEMRSAIDEAVAMIRPAAAERDITIEVEYSAACEVFVSADQQRLRQVLLNLLSNAVKYNRTGGSISLHCGDGDGGASRLSITDTGQGFTKEQRERLFSPFDRLGAEQTIVEGTGLGLALSKRLIELMEGSLWVESEPGQGSTFWIELQPAAAPAHDTPGAEAERQITRHHDLSSRDTVLYIEDNGANFDLVEGALAHLGPLELLFAMHGSLGLELAQLHEPRLILLDLHLPDMSGEQVLARLKADPGTRDIPVVILSADATERQVRRMLAAGADAYLTKPIDVPQFLETVQALIREPVAP